MRNLLLAIVVATLALSGRVVAATETTVGLGQRGMRKTAAETIEEKWGIRVESVRLSANGYVVDFRYKVLDPKKATALGDPEAKPYLVDRTTGAKLSVPSTPKVGPLRQSAESLTTGRVYFTLFANKGKAVRKGSKVTVVIGDFKAANLAVQ